MGVTDGWTGADEHFLRTVSNKLLEPKPKF